jgi:hypothetical protein
MVAGFSCAADCHRPTKRAPRKKSRRWHKCCWKKFTAKKQLAMSTSNGLPTANSATGEAPKFELDFESEEPLPVCPMRQEGSCSDEVCEACQ